MSTRLLRITKEEWRAKARAVNYNLPKLAKACGVSVRTLQRHFPDAMGKCPQGWLDEERMRAAGAYLDNGLGVLETRNELGIKSAAHFSRIFKQHYGYAPREHAVQSRNGAGNAVCRQ